jgi:hypothetical protein
MVPQPTHNLGMTYVKVSEDLTYLSHVKLELLVIYTMAICQVRRRLPASSRPR